MGRTRPLAALAVAALLAVVGCSGGGSGETDPSGSPEVSPSPSPSLTPEPSIDPEGELCRLVDDFDARLAALRAVELTLPNRVALDIELDKLEAVFGELEGADMGYLEDEMEGSFTRLGYRMGELELAVEDFRTNSRPRRAAPHVEEDSQKVADELAAFRILSRCRS